MEELIPQPKIIVEPDLAQGVLERIQFIDSEIHRQPESFRKILAKLGSSAVTIEPTKSVKTRIPARALVYEYFDQRYDRYGYFDDATELAIQHSEAHQELVHELTSIKPQSTSIGISKRGTSFDVASAESARNAVRHSRLSIYVARVAIVNGALALNPSQNSGKSAS